MEGQLAAKVVEAGAAALAAGAAGTGVIGGAPAGGADATGEAGGTGIAD